METDDLKDRLIAAAEEARARSISDVSGYAVGAALLCEDGRVVTGCNIENIVLAETCCAEKVALLKALSEGARSFRTVAVFTRSSPPATPCGSCRQLLFHWGVRDVYSGNPKGEKAHWTVEELLPGAFKVSD